MTCELEMQHNRPHMWVRDTFALGDLARSPADFIFFLHHANIDRIWASWQRDRETAGNDWSMTRWVGGVTAAAVRKAAAHPQPSTLCARLSWEEPATWLIEAATTKNAWRCRRSATRFEPLCESASNLKANLIGFP
jgi:hypothetical protein